MSGRGTRLGRYLLGERIAVGGMGEVFVATQSSLAGFEKPLVIKLMLPHLAADAAAVEMFLNEARVAARFRHPNVVQIFDVGVDTGRYFISMELIRGVSLASLMRALATHHEQLEPDLFAHVARGLCAGLEHAHAQRAEDGSPLELVHRDVSPQNVLISTDGEVKLTDFGISKVKGASSSTEPGVIKGKFEYLPPEAIQSQALDRRLDVYAAALTLFHLATLRSPFRRASDLDTLRAVLNEPLPPLREARPDLPEAACAAIARCASKRPEDRLASARELADAFPVPPGDAAARLGALIARLCEGEVKGLANKTALSKVGPGTEDLALGSVEVEAPSTGATPSRRRRGWAGYVAVALAGAALAAGAFIVNARLGRAPEPPPPAPVPAVAAVVAPPAPVPEAPPAVEPAPEEPAPKRGVRRAPPKPAARPAAGSEAPALLSIDATPWAHVSIDGTQVGDTPIASYPVTSRQVSIVFTNDDTKKRRVKTVKTRPGQRVSVHEDLR